MHMQIYSLIKVRWCVFSLPFSCASTEIASHLSDSKPTVTHFTQKPTCLGCGRGGRDNAAQLPGVLFCAGYVAVLTSESRGMITDIRLPLPQTPSPHTVYLLDTLSSLSLWHSRGRNHAPYFQALIELGLHIHKEA